MSGVVPPPPPPPPPGTSMMTTVNGTTTVSLKVPAINGECMLIDTMLSHIFNSEKQDPKDDSQSHSRNPQSADRLNPPSDNNSSGINRNAMGCPEVRIRNIEKFRECNGFTLLHTHLLARLPYCDTTSTATNVTLSTTGATGTSTNASDINPYVIVPTGTLCNSPSYSFPSLETLHHVLTALFDTLPMYSYKVTEQKGLQQEQEMDAINISNAVVKYLRQLATDDIQKLAIKYVTKTLTVLRNIFDCLSATHPRDCIEFYSFYRSMTLSMISSTLLPLKLVGWKYVSELIEACNEHRPPPRQYRVSNAGCTFVNGMYDFAGAATHDRYTKPVTDALYIQKVPLDAVEGAGKKLTLFSCRMRSQKETWWFISEADDNQPGTTGDIDYYQHKLNEHEKYHPPPCGWETCRINGIDPPPTLQPIGRVVPNGEEMNLFENQLVLWMLENNVVDLATRAASIHNEISVMSSGLIEFLASKVDCCDTGNMIVLRLVMNWYLQYGNNHN